MVPGSYPVLCPRATSCAWDTHMFARHRPSRRFTLLTTSPSSPLRPPTATDDADFWKVRPVRQAKGALDDEFRTDRKIIDYSAPPSHIVYSCFSPYPHSTSRPATRSLPKRACLQSFCPNDTSIAGSQPRALSSQSDLQRVWSQTLLSGAHLAFFTHLTISPPQPPPPHTLSTSPLHHPPPRPRSPTTNTHSCRKRTAAPTPSSAPQRTTSTSSSSGPRGTL